jgi:hypothetical protein
VHFCDPGLREEPCLIRMHFYPTAAGSVAEIGHHIQRSKFWQAQWNGAHRVALLNERFQEATRLVTEAGGGT